MKRQTMWAHRIEDRFHDFSLHSRICRMHDKEQPVFEVLVIELTVACEDCCWAWWNNEQEKFTMVYAWRSALRMCFPHRPEIEEKQGRGRMMPVSVEVIQVVDQSAWK